MDAEFESGSMHPEKGEESEQEESLDIVGLGEGQRVSDIRPRWGQRGL